MFHSPGSDNTTGSGTGNSLPKGSGAGKMSSESSSIGTAKGAQLRTPTKGSGFGPSRSTQVTSNGEAIVGYDSKGKLDIFTNEDYEKVEVSEAKCIVQVCIDALSGLA